MLPASLHFHYFTFSLDILSEKFDAMIYKSFSGVENVNPYPIHTDVAVGFPLLRMLAREYKNTRILNCTKIQKIW